jgi:hypothetical protein
MLCLPSAAIIMSLMLFGLAHMIITEKLFKNYKSKNNLFEINKQSKQLFNKFIPQLTSRLIFQIVQLFLQNICRSIFECFMNRGAIELTIKRRQNHRTLAVTFKNLLFKNSVSGNFPFQITDLSQRHQNCIKEIQTLPN